MSSDNDWNIPAPAPPTGINVYPPTPTKKQVVSEPSGSRRELVSQLPRLGGVLRTYAAITVYRWYESIYTVTTAPGSTQEYSIQVLVGNTDTKSQTKNFGVALGAEAGVDIHGISEKISATISKDTGSEKTVSVTDETISEYKFSTESTAEPTSYDVWQLVEQYVITSETTYTMPNSPEIPVGTQQGGVLTNRLSQYIALSYPLNSVTRMSPA